MAACFTALMTVVAVVSGSSTGASADASTPVVTVETGQLGGVATTSEYAYLGVPYAAPPVGPLRWKAPQSAASWSGVRQGTQTASPCAQPTSPISVASSAEDCLYLNVYVPRSAPASAPVLVYLHGGAYVTGTGSVYIGKLAARTQAIVVTVDFRLGVFGSLALPALQAENPALNYGMQDQQAALRWVQRNIAAFGGDRTRVTVLGQSSGAIGGCANLASPPAAGLFQRLILMSGLCDLSGLPGSPLIQAENNGQTFANVLGCAAGSVQMACLRGKSADAVTSGASFLQGMAGVLPAWTPVIDGVVLTDNPGALLRQGKLPHIPVMDGVTRNEGDLFAALYLQKPGGVVATDADYQSFLSGVAGPYVGAWLASQYPTSTYGSPVKALGALMTDSLYSCPTRPEWDAFSATTATYSYQFDDPNAPGILSLVPRGSSHGSDLAYLFNPASPALTANQQGLAQQMTRYWANFAATGDPNKGPFAGQDPAWPRYAAGSTAQLRDLQPVGTTGTTLDVTSLRTQHRCSLWGS